MILSLEGLSLRAEPLKCPNHKGVNMELKEISREDANAFVALHHRHNTSPVHVCQGSVGLWRDGELVGVALGGTPRAREYNGRGAFEVYRVCCLPGIRNGCSRLYGWMRRRAAALGYRGVITYTLRWVESGASLRGAGFEVDGYRRPRAQSRGGWGTRAESRGKTLRGSVPSVAKTRWVALTRKGRREGWRLMSRTAAAKLAAGKGTDDVV